MLWLQEGPEHVAVLMYLVAAVLGGVVTCAAAASWCGDALRVLRLRRHSAHNPAKSARYAWRTDSFAILALASRNASGDNGDVGPELMPERGRLCDNVLAADNRPPGLWTPSVEALSRSSGTCVEALVGEAGDSWTRCRAWSLSWIMSLACASSLIPSWSRPRTRSLSLSAQSARTTTPPLTSSIPLAFPFTPWPASLLHG